MNKFNFKSRLNNKEKVAILEYEASDYGNALAMLHMFGDKFAIVRELGNLYYNGKYWQIDHNDSFLYEHAVEVMKIRGMVTYQFATDENKNQCEAVRKCVSTNNKHVNNLISAFTKLSEIQHDFEEFTPPPYLINVDNGTVDIRTKKLLPHNREDGFTSCSKVKWVPESTDTTFEKFALSCLWLSEEKHIVDFFQMCLGYCVTGYTREEKAIYVWGESRSGKGTIIDVIQNVLPKEMAASTPFATFTKKRGEGDQGFDLAPLYSCRFVAASEGKRQENFNESAFKTITGNDKMQVAFKGKDQFNFKPVWKIFLVSNFAPRGDVVDEAFWGRFIMLRFPTSHLGNEDKTLKEQFESESVLEGALRWLVDGAYNWYNSESGLNTPDEYVQLLSEVRDQQDNIKPWMEANCTVDKADKSLFCSFKVMFDDYCRFQKDMGNEEPWKYKTFIDYFRGKGYTEGTTRVKGKTAFGTPTETTKQTKGFHGITLPDWEARELMF